MTFLPIIQRELLVRARSRATWWVRLGIAAVGCGIAFVMTLVAAADASGGAGLVLLVILAALAWAYCLIEGLRHTADSLSEEKREGTLGLLFLTDLRGYDVVLGKFSAASITSFYGLLGLLPALAIPLTLGGVTGGEVGRIALALLNTLFFGLTTGTVISAVSRESRRAQIGTILVTLLFTGILPAMDAWRNWGAALPSPWTVFWLAFASHYTPVYWTSNLLLFLLSSLWLALASGLLPHLWQDRPFVRPRPRDPAKADARADKRERERARLLDQNPALWLAVRSEDQRPWLWTLVVLASGAGVTVWLLYPGDWDVAGNIFLGAVAVHFVINCWVAFEGTRTLADARNTGALELLLSTPLPTRLIVRGLQLALRRLFFGPVLLLLSVEVFLLIAQIFAGGSGNGSLMPQILGIIAIAGAIATFILDLLAVGHTAMWLGLASRNSAQATARTILYVLILPLPLWCCSCVGPGLILSKSVIFLTWAQGKLLNEFRRVVTERFDTPASPRR